MARSAVLSSRTVSDVIYNAGILVVLMPSGASPCSRLLAVRKYRSIDR
jgi:hypothetical protein